MKPLHLRERCSTLCRLALDEVTFLATHHPGRFALLPTPRRHVWRITPAGVAGVIHTPGRSVIVSPKIPLRNVVALLDLDAPVLCDAPGDGLILLDLLAGQLVRLVEQRIESNLHHDYREQHSQGTMLQGRLDVAAQVREQSRVLLHGRHDEFTADLPCHQIPRVILERMSAVVSSGVRGEIQRALHLLRDVSSLTLTPDVWATLDVPPGYGPLLDLCRLLDRGRSPGLLLELEPLFERYVTRIVREAGGERVQVQRTTTIRGADPSHPTWDIRPDVCLGDGVIVDAKWKSLPKEGVIGPDVYQVLAYGAILGAMNVVLVYAGSRWRWWEYAVGGRRLLICSVDVAGDTERMVLSRRRLIQRLRRLSTSGGCPS